MIHYLTRKKIWHINAKADLSFKIYSKEEYTAMVDLSNMIGLKVRPIEEGMTAALGDGTLVVYSDGEIVLSDLVEKNVGGQGFSHTCFTSIDLRGINMSAVKCMSNMFAWCEAKRVYIDRMDYRKVDLSYMMNCFNGELITDDMAIKKYLGILDIEAEIMNKFRLLARNSCVVIWFDDEKDKDLYSHFDLEREKFEKIKSEICLKKENFKSLVLFCYIDVATDKKMFSVEYSKVTFLSQNIKCMTEKRELMELWLYELAFSKIDLTDLTKFNRGINIVEMGMLYSDEYFNDINPEMSEVKQSVIDKATEDRNRLVLGLNNGNVNIYT